MRIVAVLTLACLLVLSACGGSNNVDTGSVDPTSTATEAIAESDSETASETAAETQSTTETEESTQTETATNTATQPEITATATPTQPASSPTSPATQTEAPTTAASTNEHAAIGSTITFDSGQTTTIYAIERPVTSDLWTPDIATNEFLALDVEECAGPNVPSGTTVSANPFDFTLLMPDNTRIEPSIGVKEPALHVTDMLTGDCVRGWATFEVPQGQQPTEIRYQGYDWEFDQLIGRWSPSATQEVVQPPASTQAATASTAIAAIGDTISFDNGMSVTLHAIERDITDDIFQPEAGNTYVALDVEVCAGPNVPVGSTVSANPYDFQFLLADNTRLDPTVGVKEPALNATDLLAGDCIRSWASFEVPTTATTTEVRYQGYDWEFEQMIGRWSVN